MSCILLHLCVDTLNFSYLIAHLIHFGPHYSALPSGGWAGKSLQVR